MDPVIHVIASDLAAEELRTLRVVLAAPEAGAGGVLFCGSGAIPRVPAAVDRVRAMLDAPWLGAAAVRRALRAALPGRSDATALLHAWSPEALQWCAGIADGKVRIVAQAPIDTGLAQLARWARVARGRSPFRFVCSSATARRRMIEGGVFPDDVRLIRPSVDYAELNEIDRARLRRRIGAGDDALLIAPLPPITRASGAFYAAWAALLLEKLLPATRLLLGETGPESERIVRLVRSCRHEHMLCHAGRLTVAELVRAADVGVFLPERDAPTDALAWALAAGLPTVASAVPCCTEFVAHGQNAWLCRPRTPKDATRRLLQVLESPEARARTIERGRTLAYATFGRQRMIEEFAQLYRETRADRVIMPAGRGDSR